jgi:Fe-S-cluster containining protein
VRHKIETELAILCHSCGLCCDGSLFGRVRLEPTEVNAANRKRLRVIDSKEAFEQPCPALAPVGRTDGARRTCSIYGDRPKACRRFECRLFERHRSEGGPLEPRLAAVRRVRELLAWLEAVRPSPEDDEAAIPSAVDQQTFHELLRRLDEDFARA